VNYYFIDYSDFATTSIVVEAKATTGTDEVGGVVQDAPVVVWSGFANVYDETQTIRDVGGVGQIATGRTKVIIDPTTSGYLPQIPVGARVRVLNPEDGTTTHAYRVDHSHTWDTAPSSVELTCVLEQSW
jgi:hypothetical protein